MPYMHKRTFDISNSMPTTVTRNTDNGTEIHYDPMPDHFQVDELIAIPLQILNRKGYLLRAVVRDTRLIRCFSQKPKTAFGSPFARTAFAFV